ncbi:MAG: DUF1571 domain-containing protein [Deltaproteobacteria bacterium]|nr:DUF1571 domain-containing protein [Deltaproteobacteria bacterium]
MLFGIFLIAFAVVSNSPLSASMESFNTLENYAVTIRSSGDGSTEAIKYFYKKPGFIRMEFIEPHKGAVLIYNPYTKRVKLRPFGFFKSFVMDLSPDDSLIKSSKGHRIDKSDIGTLLKNARMLGEDGDIKALRKEVVGGKSARVVSVRGRGKTVGGVGSLLLWIDEKSHLPLKVASYAPDGKLIEEVLMEDLRINQAFPADFFSIG